jgi:hypothetical protein
MILYLKIDWKQHHYLYTKIAFNGSNGVIHAKRKGVRILIKESLAKW